MILEAYIKRQTVPVSNPDVEPPTISDPFLIGALMNICRTIHNSLKFVVALHFSSLQRE
jgi:hypothetical protein